MPHKIVQNVALLYQQFNDIESVKLEDLLSYFELKLEKTDNFNAFGLPFRDFLEQAIEEEDTQKKANKLKAVKISFQILF